MRDDLIDSDPQPGSLADFYRLNPKIKERADLLIEAHQTARFVADAASRIQEQRREERDDARTALARYDEYAATARLVNDLDANQLRDTSDSSLLSTKPSHGAISLASARAELVANLDAADAAFKRAIAAANAAKSAVADAAAPVAAVRKLQATWLAEGARQRVKLNRPTIKLGKTETYAAFIKTQLGRISDLDLEVEQVKNTHRPKDEVIAEVLADLDRHASKGRIGVNIPDLNAPRSVLQQRSKPTARVVLPTFHASVEVDFASMFLAQNRDSIAEDLVGQIEQAYSDGREVLTDLERKAKLISLRNERRSLENLAAESWWKARDAGETLACPAGLSARAILGTE